MSFSSEVKEELTRAVSHPRHCQIAELTAIITMCGGVRISAAQALSLKIQTENPGVVRRAAGLIASLFHVRCEVSVRLRQHNRQYTAAVTSHKAAEKILQAAHLLTAEGEIREQMQPVDNLVIQKSCCKKAFLRGAFLTAGSVSDPKSSYHLEMVTGSEAKAEQLKQILRTLGFEGKVTKRRSHYIVYIKEGDQIADFLGAVGATKALLEMENVRILKEIAGNVNRQVNCETANLNKTITAAVTSIADIQYIQTHGGLEQLEPNLQETAQLRLRNPDISLAALGDLHETPVGKSGVNHRLKKLSAIAERMRQEDREIPELTDAGKG